MTKIEPADVAHYLSNVTEWDGAIRFEDRDEPLGELENFDFKDNDTALLTFTNQDGQTQTFEVAVREVPTVTETEAPRGARKVKA